LTRTESTSVRAEADSTTMGVLKNESPLAGAEADSIDPVGFGTHT
jgi:hypothetical protein